MYSSSCTFYVGGGAVRTGVRAWWLCVRVLAHLGTCGCAMRSRSLRLQYSSKINTTTWWSSKSTPQPASSDSKARASSIKSRTWIPSLLIRAATGPSSRCKTPTGSFRVCLCACLCLSLPLPAVVRVRGCDCYCHRVGPHYPLPTARTRAVPPCPTHSGRGHARATSLLYKSTH